jgi:hypothetical protein
MCRRNAERGSSRQIIVESGGRLQQHDKPRSSPKNSAQGLSRPAHQCYTALRCHITPALESRKTITMDTTEGTINLVRESYFVVTLMASCDRLILGTAAWYLFC